jgi:bacterioferritin-associated ferredoxin
MNELLIRDQALRHCRKLNAALPCTEPCDACWEAAKRQIIRAERDEWLKLETGLA